MSKAVLVMDMPDNCRDCEYFGFPCRLTNMKCNWFSENGRNKNCPLRELPERKPPSNMKPAPIIEEYYREYDRGWNTCLDAITGEVQQ